MGWSLAKLVSLPENHRTRLVRKAQKDKFVQMLVPPLRHTFTDQYCTARDIIKTSLGGLNNLLGLVKCYNSQHKHVFTKSIQ